MSISGQCLSRYWFLILALAGMIHGLFTIPECCRCKEQYKWLAGGVEIIDAIPLNPSGKWYRLIHSQTRFHLCIRQVKSCDESCAVVLRPCRLIGRPGERNSSILIKSYNMYLTRNNVVVYVKQRSIGLCQNLKTDQGGPGSMRQNTIM